MFVAASLCFEYDPHHDGCQCQKYDYGSDRLRNLVVRCIEDIIACQGIEQVHDALSPGLFPKRYAPSLMTSLFVLARDRTRLPHVKMSSSTPTRVKPTIP